jgi:hypothetical protein
MRVHLKPTDDGGLEVVIECAREELDLLRSRFSQRPDDACDCGHTRSVHRRSVHSGSLGSCAICVCELFEQGGGEAMKSWNDDRSEGLLCECGHVAGLHREGQECVDLVEHDSDKVGPRTAFVDSRSKLWDVCPCEHFTPRKPPKLVTQE